MKVSVVIPVYNEERYIERCLKSLDNQSEKAEEIIVIDNNCTDRTIEKARHFTVDVIKEKKQGMIPARNTGFDAASYEIIARCDADSYLPPDWIATIKKNFQKKPIVALSGPHYFYDLLPQFKQVITHINDYLIFTSTRKLLGYNTLYGANMALTKDVWKKVRSSVCLDEKITQEDTDMALHIHEFGDIMYDYNLTIGISARRLKYNPYSFFIAYPITSYRTIMRHTQK